MFVLWIIETVSIVSTKLVTIRPWALPCVQVMVVLKREFATPDEEMKKIVLKVVKQCVGTEGVEPDYIRTEVREQGREWKVG